MADEAAKLFGALSELGAGPRDRPRARPVRLASHAAASARDIDEHLATGSAECTYCPICRTVHAVRQTSPEVRAHLAVAAASLMQAAAGILATAVPDEDRAGVRPRRRHRAHRPGRRRPEGDA